MRWIVLVATVLLSLLVLSSPAHALAPYPVHATGIDVSWPDTNCLTAPPPGTAFGIVGVNGGLDFRPNHCLLQEASRFGNNYSLYLNTGYPGLPLALRYRSSPRRCQAGDQTCLAYNWGYNDVLYSLQYASRLDVHSTYWWLDVESVNSWSTYTSVNRQALHGMADALRQRTFLPVIGFYAYPGQWQTITGNWRNQAPAWAATGSSARNDALAACREPGFTGGQLVLTQYIHTLDEDYACR
jgi:hypothetical protein